jgi:D-alanyl-D-alanine carboxypeptidase
LGKLPDVTYPIRRGLGLLAALVVLVLPASASAFTPQQIAGFQQILQLDQQQTGYPGEILGVWQQGNGGFVGTAGVSSLQSGSPISTRDHFRIGSVTKTFTATVILQLAERGELHLSDHIDRYLHGIPGGHRVTIKRLLNQTSGYPDIWIDAPQILRDPHRQWNVRRLVIQSLRRQSRACAPGACWHYSNVNYLTLGLIAAKASAEPVKRLLAAGVFDRLGLHDTRLASSKPVPAPVGQGYFYNSANFPLDTSRWNFSWSWTAGGITSTLRDMKRYCPAMATGHGLIGARMERKRLNLVDISQQTDTPGAGYGLGIFELPTAAGTFIGHDGAVPGYDTLCLYSPQSRTTMVAFGTTSVELDPISPDRIPVQMLFTVAPALAQIVAAGTY